LISDDLLLDDIFNRRMLMMLMEKYGMHVEVAEDGLEAVNMVLKNLHRYRLILMDNLMPKMVKPANNFISLTLFDGILLVSCY